MKRQSISQRRPISFGGAKRIQVNPNARVIADRFRLDSLIWQSVNGEVHQAFDLQMGSVVAVKILRSRFLTGEHFGVRLRREFDVLRSLDHPSVVKVVDHGQASEKEMFLAMEFVKGITLEHLVKRDGPAKAGKLAPVLSQVAGALDAAHAIGVVHRDVNPGNVLIGQDESGKPTVKLLDFGLAKMLDPDESHQLNATGAAMIVGRAEFMAPEQAGSDPVSPATDIYTLGLTAFFALTGKPPFSEASEIETLLAQMKKPTPAFAAVNPKVSESAMVEEVVRKALAKKEAERYQSAGEFAYEFSKAAGVAAAAPARAAVKSIEKTGARRRASWNRLVRSAVSVAAVALVAVLLFSQLRS